MNMAKIRELVLDLKKKYCQRPPDEGSHGCGHCPNCILITGYEEDVLDIIDSIHWKVASLKWEDILLEAIKNRPTSWKQEPVRELRNASDEIASATMKAMEKAGIIKPLETFMLKDKDGNLI